MHREGVGFGPRPLVVENAHFEQQHQQLTDTNIDAANQQRKAVLYTISASSREGETMRVNGGRARALGRWGVTASTANPA